MAINKDNDISLSETLSRDLNYSLGHKSVSYLFFIVYSISWVTTPFEIFSSPSSHMETKN